MMTAATEGPSYRARLECSTNAGTMFVSGDFDPYGLDQLRDSAGYGVESVRIRVDGIDRAEAEEVLARLLAGLLKRGVKVYVSSN